MSLSLCRSPILESVELAAANVGTSGDWNQLWWQGQQGKAGGEPEPGGKGGTGAAPLPGNSISALGKGGFAGSYGQGRILVAEES